MSEKQKKGLLLVMSGPSCVGKGTICKDLFAAFPQMSFSVSATTRSPRDGEIDGVHYYFMDKAEFEAGIAENVFLEYEQVFENNNYYGTPKEYVEKKRLLGYDVLLEIDVKGAMQVKEKVKDSVLIFIMPPSIEALQARFADRGTESPEEIALRLSRAESEMAMAKAYDYIVVNDDLQEACDIVRSIVKAEHHRNFKKELL